MSKNTCFTDENRSPCVRSKCPRVYRHHAHTCFNMCARGAGTHGDILNVHTETCLVDTLGFQRATHTHHDHNTTQRHRLLPLGPFSSIPFTFGSCSLLHCLRCEFGRISVRFEECFFAICSCCHADLHWCTRVNFLHLRCLMCRDLVSDEFSSAMSNSSIVQQKSWASTFFTARIFPSSRLFTKPSFVLVRLVGEVPEGVIKVLHVLCAITFVDVADQRSTHQASV